MMLVKYDLFNEQFKVYTDFIQDYELRIYNRWGEEVFYSDDLDIVWDGGKGVAGTYTYIISVVDKIGEFHKKNGFVLIE